MPTKRVIPASPRVGATRREWEERASLLYRAVFGRKPKTTWSNGNGSWEGGESREFCGGIEIEGWKIIPEDYEVAIPAIIPMTRKVRGYSVIGVKQVGGGYYDPPDTEEFLADHCATPEEAISCVLRRQVDDVVDGFLESTYEERNRRERERYHAEMDG